MIIFNSAIVMLLCMNRGANLGVGTASRDMSKIAKQVTTMLLTVTFIFDKVYICIRFVSVVYEIMCNTCVTLIYFFILYIYVQVEICYNVAHLILM